MAPRFEVVVGTYEQFTLGYKIDDIVNEYKMHRTFAMHSHLGSVRTVASKNNYLASAAADSTVCLYDMKNRIENGKLTHHSDTINCISFTPDASHVITGSKDGSMAIIRCGNWQIEKHWESPHKGLSVDTLAIHPTGKLALTTGGDGVLRTWNLIKGRQAYATNLIPRWKGDAKYVSVLKWNPSGQKYVIGANKMLDIYSVVTASIDERLMFDAKVVCAEFLDNDLIAIGLSDGKLVVHDIKENTQILEVSAHNARLRCMARDDDYLVTASSDGEIKVWSFTKDSLTMLNKANCDARILCMTLSIPQQGKVKGKKLEKQVESEVEDDSEDEDEVDEEDEEEKVIQFKKKEIKGLSGRQRVVIEDEGETEIKEKKQKNKNKRSRNEDEIGEDHEEKSMKSKIQKVIIHKRKASSEDTSSKKKQKKDVDILNNNSIKNKKNKRKSLNKEDESIEKKKLRMEFNKQELISDSVNIDKKKKTKNKKKNIRQ